MSDDQPIETTEHEARPYRGPVQLVGDEPMTSLLTWRPPSDPPKHVPTEVLLWIESPEGPDDWSDWLPGRYTNNGFRLADGRLITNDCVFKLWAEPMSPSGGKRLKPQEPTEQGHARSNTVAWYERRKRTLQVEIAAEQGRSMRAVAALREEYAQADEACEQLLRGMDGRQILLAEHILYVHGQVTQAGADRAEAIDEALKSLLAGGGDLLDRYVGCKNYDRWQGQFFQSGYGLSPRHGIVRFAIGLHEPVRARQQRPALNEDEINACVYYLRNLEQIQDAASVVKSRAATL